MMRLAALLTVCSLAAPVSARVPPRYHGHLSREAITTVVNRNSAALQRCYERGLAHDSTIGNQLTLDFIIRRSGRVGPVRAKQSSVGERVAGCAIRQVQQWLFPRPGGELRVTYPFVFATPPSTLGRGHETSSWEVFSKTSPHRAELWVPTVAVAFRTETRTRHQ